MLGHALLPSASHNTSAFTLLSLSDGAQSLHAHCGIAACPLSRPSSPQFVTSLQVGSDTTLHLDYVGLLLADWSCQASLGAHVFPG